MLLISFELSCGCKEVISSAEVALFASAHIGSEIRIEQTYRRSETYIVIIHKAVELVVGTAEWIEFLVFTRSVIRGVATEVIYSSG